MKIEIYLCRPIYHPVPVFAWAIMVFQKMFPWNKDSYSHMAVGYEVGGKQVVVHITGDGVKWESLGKFVTRYKITETIYRDIDTNVDDVYSWIELQLAKKYDNWQIVGHALQFLRITDHNILGANLNRYVCSEMVASFMSEFNGWELGDSDNWDLSKTVDRLMESE